MCLYCICRSQLEEVKRQDYIGMIRERDVKISELSQALEYLRTESKGEEVEEEEEEEEEGRKSSHVVKATLSVGVQTVTEDSPAAVLPVNTYPDLLAMDSLVRKRSTCVVGFGEWVWPHFDRKKVGVAWVIM